MRFLNLLILLTFTFSSLPCFAWLSSEERQSWKQERELKREQRTQSFIKNMRAKGLCPKYIQKGNKQILSSRQCTKAEIGEELYNQLHPQVVYIPVGNNSNDNSFTNFLILDQIQGHQLYNQYASQYRYIPQNNPYWRYR